MQIGLPITGLLKAKSPLIVEDFHNLQALTVPHHGARHDLGATYQQLAEQARAFNWFLRPYWRVTVGTERFQTSAFIRKPWSVSFLIANGRSIEQPTKFKATLNQRQLAKNAKKK